jgi:phage gp29-like protein
LANDFSKLVASDFTIADNASRRGWLKNFIDDVLDPENDLIAKVSRRPDVWLRMRWRIGVIRSAWEQLTTPVVASDWVCEPAPFDSSAESEKECKELTQLLTVSDGFRDVLAGIAEIAYRGHGAVELGGRIGGFGDVMKGEQLIPKAIIVPSFGVTYELETSKPRLLLQDGDQIRGEDMTQARWRWKFLHGSFGSTEGGNWFGAGYGLALFWLYTFLTQSEKWWANAMERFGTPIPLAQITEGDWNSQKTAIFEMFKAMQAAQDGFAIPKGVSLSFTNEGIHAWPNFDTLDENLQKKIRLTILGATDSQDPGEKGAFAAVKIRAQNVTPRQWQIANLISTVGSQVVRKASDYLFDGPRSHRLVPKFDDPIDPEQQREGLRLGAELGLEAPNEHIYEVCSIPIPKDKVGKTTTLSIAQAAGPSTDFGRFPSFAEGGPTQAERRKEIGEEEERTRERVTSRVGSLTDAVARELVGEIAGGAETQVKRAVKKKAVSSPGNGSAPASS